MATTTKQPTSSKPQPPAIPTVATAEEVLAALEQDRAAVVAARAADDTEMRRSAYSARVLHELEASRSLDEISKRSIERDQQLREIDCAVFEARERLAAAKAAEVRAVDQARTAEARKLVKELAEVFPFVDKHLALAARGLLAIHEGVAQLHAAGFSFPSDSQVRINLAEVIETWAHSLPRSLHNQLRDGVRFLQPGARKSAAQYWAAIEATLNNSISGAVDVPVPKAPAMQKPDARDRQEAAAATREFLGGGA
jgi:hypothetical protein